MESNRWLFFPLFLFVCLCNCYDPQETQLDIPLSQSYSSSFLNKVTYFVTKSTHCDANSDHINSVIQSLNEKVGSYRL